MINGGAVLEHAKTDDLTIALVPQGQNGVSTAVLKDQGHGQAAFEIGAVDPGEYELRIQSTKGFFINSALYIQSVKLNGSEVDPLLINLPEKSAVNLHVDLGNRMASVHPHVSQEKALAAPQVLLLPASLLNLSGDNQPQQSPRYEIGWSMGDLCDGIQSWATQVYSRKMENLPPGRCYALALQAGTQIDLGVQGPRGFHSQEANAVEGTRKDRHAYLESGGPS